MTSPGFVIVSQYAATIVAVHARDIFPDLYARNVASLA